VQQGEQAETPASNIRKPPLYPAELRGHGAIPTFRNCRSNFYPLFVPQDEPFFLYGLDRTGIRHDVVLACIAGGVSGKMPKLVQRPASGSAFGLDGRSEVLKWVARPAVQRPF